VIGAYILIIPDVFAIGIFIMLASFACGFSIGKVTVLLSIGWWMYFIFLSNNPEMKNFRVRVFLGIFLLLSVIEAFML